MKYLYFGFLLMIPSILISQPTIFIGDKSFEASASMVFTGKNALNDLTIQFAKKNDGNGILVVAKETHWKYIHIGGNILLYLDGGIALKIYEAGIKDYANEISTTLYLLTKQDIETLKKSNILSVRYMTKCGAGAMGPSCDETFIANNKDAFGRDIQYTPQVIKELFEECYGIEELNEIGERVMNYTPKLVSVNPFEEYAIGLSVKGNDRYISLVLRDILAGMDQQTFTGKLEMNLINGTRVILDLTNSQSQHIGGSKVVMGIYYIQPAEYEKLMKGEIKSIKLYKLTKGWQNDERLSEKNIVINENKNAISKYLNCSVK